MNLITAQTPFEDHKKVEGNIHHIRDMLYYLVSVYNSFCFINVYIYNSSMFCFLSVVTDLHIFSLCRATFNVHKSGLYC